MCLAIPVRVNEVINVDEAIVEADGIRKLVSISLLDDVKVGDYVILHVGFALNKIDQQEAEKTLALFAEMAEQK